MTGQQADLCATIGRVMGDVLHREPLAAGEDFFACGGDSLQAVMVLRCLVGEHGLTESAVTDELESELSIAIFDDASPASLASIVTAHTPGGTSHAHHAAV